ncbi:MAG: CHRD domain-containing protein [Alphaproteobacteria bacterium]|nr:CHRD domain-containing protein [Alphaproteobacteria bacterium]
MGGGLSRRAVVAFAALICVAWMGSAHAASMKFKVPLMGSEEVPAVMSKAKATAYLTWNPSTRIVTWHIVYSKLSSPATMAHFHNGAMGKDGPVMIWLTKKGEPVKSPINGKATLSPEQAQQFEAGDWYINVHSKDHPAGEIRGQVTPPKG